MSKKSVVVMPDTPRILEKMGEQIKLARLRRNLATELVAERAGISRATLWAVEKGPWVVPGRGEAESVRGRPGRLPVDREISFETG